MAKGRNFNPNNIKLSLEAENNTFVIAKVKKHKIGLLENICSDAKLDQEADLNLVKQIIELWSKEKEVLDYSPAERKYVDELIAEAVLDYQIKQAKKTGKIDSSISDGLNPKAYNKAVENMIRSIIPYIPLGDINRLLLENLVTSTMKDNLVGNEKVWEIILDYENGIEKNKKEILPVVKPPKLTFMTIEEYDKRIPYFWRKHSSDWKTDYEALKEDEKKMAAEITDFAILLGGILGSVNGKTINGWYWLKSTIVHYRPNEKELTKPRLIFHNGSRSASAVIRRDTGIRPVISFPSIYEIPSNTIRGIMLGQDGEIEVEYGYYPQNAAPSDIQRELEQAFKEGKLRKTGNVYTTDSRRFNDYFSPFKEKQYEEYEYNGKRYVRVKANIIYADNDLAKYGKEYKNGDNVWIEVQPIKWKVFEELGIMITEKIICAGVQFDRPRGDYNKEELNDITNDYKIEDFPNVDINKFMVVYMAPEMVQILREKQLQKVTGQNVEIKER